MENRINSGKWSYTFYLLLAGIYCQAASVNVTFSPSPAIVSGVQPGTTITIPLTVTYDPYSDCDVCAHGITTRVSFDLQYDLVNVSTGIVTAITPNQTGFIGSTGCIYNPALSGSFSGPTSGIFIMPCNLPSGDHWLRITVRNLSLGAQPSCTGLRVSATDLFTGLNQTFLNTNNCVLNNVMKFTGVTGLSLAPSASPSVLYPSNSPNTLSSNLNAGAGGSTYTYSWSPSSGLSSTTSATPVAVPPNTITYTVTATSSQSCVLTGSVKVTVLFPR